MTGMGNMCIIESRNTKQYFTCAIVACPGGEPRSVANARRSREVTVSMQLEYAEQKEIVVEE